MNWKEPVTLNELQKELHAHAQDGRSDALFRIPIVMDNVGALMRYMSHDRLENPLSRPHGTKMGEISDAGHAMVQLMTYCDLRGIKIQEAINMALVNLREKDFMKTEVFSENIIGKCGMNGRVKGKVWLSYTNSFSLPENPKEWILITPHPESDARMKQFAGIVTDNGGTNCHAAIIAREFGIPCIVGTGNATKLLKNEMIIEMNATEGTVKICEQ